MLVAQLPEQSRLAYAIHGDAATWGSTEHLLAIIGDRIQNLVWMNAKKGTPKPKAIPRPKAKRNTVALRSMGERLLAQRRRSQRAKRG